MGKKAIYFERQDADLMCGEHALNMLMQGPYFSADILSNAAAQLDADERIVQGIPLDQFTSQNVSDSGYFSIQVLRVVLKTQHVELFDFESPRFIHLSADPVNCHGFIVNQSKHWFTLRRFGSLWFILNSLSNEPKHIPNEFFNSYIRQLHQNFNVQLFHVIGLEHHVCEADRAAHEGKLYIESRISSDAELNAIIESSSQSTEVDDFEAAIAKSKEEYELNEALKKSLVENNPEPTPPTAEEIRQKRLARFANF